MQQQREAGEDADRLLLIHATLDSTKRARLSREAEEGDRITGDRRGQDSRGPKTDRDEGNPRSGEHRETATESGNCAFYGDAVSARMLK